MGVSIGERQPPLLCLLVGEGGCATAALQWLVGGYKEGATYYRVGPNSSVYAPQINPSLTF